MASITGDQAGGHQQYGQRSGAGAGPCAGGGACTGAVAGAGGAAADVAEGAVLKKTLVKDLRQDFNWLHEKAEGMVVFQGGLWVVNDNDGAGWTRLLNAGRP